MYLGLIPARMIGPIMTVRKLKQGMAGHWDCDSCITHVARDGRQWVAWLP